MTGRRCPTLALAAVLLATGCTGYFGQPGSPSPTAIEPQLIGTTATGGQCVESPKVGLAVESHREGDRRTVTIAGNVTVAGAHYVIDEITLTMTHDRTATLDVTTRAAMEKASQDCPNGGIVHYRATVVLPANDFDLRVRHDGTLVSQVGSGDEP